MRELHLPSIIEFTKRFELRGSHFVYGVRRKQPRPRIPLICQLTDTQNLYLLVALAPSVVPSGLILDAKYSLASEDCYRAYAERVQHHRNLGKSSSESRRAADIDSSTLFCFASELIGQTYPEHWRQQLILKRDRERV